jgi:hypothetical protein
VAEVCHWSATERFQTLNSEGIESLRDPTDKRTLTL